MSDCEELVLEGGREGGGGGGPPEEEGQQLSYMYEQSKNHISLIKQA